MSTINVNKLLKSGISKQIFNIKEPDSNGLLLEIYNFPEDNPSKTVQIRFTHVAYNNEGTILAASDQNGNIYVLNFLTNKMWTIQETNSCTVLKFSMFQSNEIIVGLNSGILVIINTEFDSNMKQLNGHKHPVQEISFSTGSTQCITSSAYESILWNLENNVKLQVLNLEEDNSLKHVLFMPVSNNILACFNDDTIYIWKNDSFETFKQISPSAWNKLPLKSIAFTKNGRAMVLGGYSKNLYIFILDTWSFAKTIVLPNSIQAIRKLLFISQPFDGGNNRVLCILAGSGILYFYDMENSTIIGSLASNLPIFRFTCSDNGKQITCICTNGEIKIYNLSKYIETKQILKNEKLSRKVSPIKPHKSESSCKIQQQISNILNLEKLKAILKEFGKYPDMFRLQIWNRILELPNNKEQYNYFINFNTSVEILIDLDKKYTLQNKSLAKNLKRLISNLITWCPFLKTVEFLPKFVFPFVKIFCNNPLMCFEAVCTILINWCQHWFEYHPLPPLNIMALVENLLLEHDPELLNHLTCFKITSKIYALPLLQSVFSEVLTPSDWCKLWDHILSNEPSFFLMVVAAYSIVSRSTLATLKTETEFVYFYTHPHPIDMKKLIAKSYLMLKCTVTHNHPRQYLAYFNPLSEGPYPTYMDYPQTLQTSDVKMKTIKENEQNLRCVEENLLDMQRDLKKELIADLNKRDDNIKRAEELQGLYLEKLQEEHDNIMNLREKIAELQKTVLEHQILLLNSTKNVGGGQQSKERLLKIEKLLHDIDHCTVLNKSEFNSSEQELLNHYAELLKNKLKIEELLHEDNTLTNDSSCSLGRLKHHQLDLSKQIKNVHLGTNSTDHLKQLNIVTGLSAIDGLINKLEYELAKTLSSNTNAKQCNDKDNVALLEAQTAELENEVKCLLKKLNKIKISYAAQETKKKKCCCSKDILTCKCGIVTVHPIPKNDGKIAPRNSPRY